MREFIESLLQFEPGKRPTVKELLDGEFLNDITNENNNKPVPVGQPLKLQKTKRDSLKGRNDIMTEVLEDEEGETEIDTVKD